MSGYKDKTTPVPKYPGNQVFFLFLTNIYQLGHIDLEPGPWSSKISNTGTSSLQSFRVWDFLVEMWWSGCCQQETIFHRGLQSGRLGVATSSQPKPSVNGKKRIHYYIYIIPQSLPLKWNAFALLQQNRYLDYSMFNLFICARAVRLRDVSFFNSNISCANTKKKIDLLSGCFFW